MKTRRMTLLVLAILGVMVLITTVSPPRTTTQGGSSRSATPSAAGLSGSDPEQFDVTATLSAELGAKPQTVEAELGDNVEIVVEGRGPASVSLGDLRTAVFEQGLPARFAFLAETPGTYPLVLGDEGRRIGALKIR